MFSPDEGNRTGFRNVVSLFLVCSWIVCYCVLCGFSQVCLFCIGNLTPLHVVVCEWLCHLLPPVFFWLLVFVCVCAHAQCCVQLCVVCVSQVCSVLVFWPLLRVVNCE
jgi:hypothetical protein